MCRHVVFLWLCFSWSRGGSTTQRGHGDHKHQLRSDLGLGPESCRGSQRHLHHTIRRVSLTHTYEHDTRGKTASLMTQVLICKAPLTSLWIIIEVIDELPGLTLCSMSDVAQRRSVVLHRFSPEWKKVMKSHSDIHLPSRIDAFCSRHFGRKRVEFRTITMNWLQCSVVVHAHSLTRWTGLSWSKIPPVPAI